MNRRRMVAYFLVAVMVFLAVLVMAERTRQFQRVKEEEIAPIQLSL